MMVDNLEGLFMIYIQRSLDLRLNISVIKDVRKMLAKSWCSSRADDYHFKDKMKQLVYLYLVFLFVCLFVCLFASRLNLFLSFWIIAKYIASFIAD